MARISVDVPDGLKDQIKETAERKNFKSPSEYIRQALREKLEEDSELDQELLLRALKLKQGDVETTSIDDIIEKYE
ncbi:ribbon-helix-helix domain-containing protein [Candidatus Nanohalococcus occultus]|uniref:ribbon-helix-helix domain-containing protein n=1 Tax=Candidatus Nanohalococcus occultus TaxID=2978047 RepID=UPI0039E113C1